MLLKLIRLPSEVEAPLLLIPNQWRLPNFRAMLLLARVLWRRDARSNVLREENNDLRRRIDAADGMSKLACFNLIRSTFGPVSEGYTLASSADRKRILKEIWEVARQSWSASDSPQALAFGVIMVNIPQVSCSG